MTSTHTPDKTSIPKLLLLIGISIAIFSTLAALSLHSIADDSFITFSYVHRFLEGKGLTWTDGAYVEGYSNALWAWVLILAGLLGASIPAAAQVFGIGLCIITILAIFAVDWPQKNGSRDSSLIAKFIGALTLSFSGVFTVWSAGGLEQPLLVALLALLFVSVVPILDALEESSSPFPPPSVSRRRIITVGTLLALLVTVRPDGTLYTAILVATILLFGRFTKKSFRESIQLASIPFLTWLGLLAFRLWYYGDYVPNTAYAKIGFSISHMFHHGSRYLLRGYGLLFPLFLVVPALCLLSVRERLYRPRVFFLTLIIVAWSTYLFVIRGDVDPPSRHFMLIIVMVAFQLSAFIEIMAQRNPLFLSRSNYVLLSLLIGFYAVVNFFEAEVRDARAQVNRFGKNNDLSIKYSELLKTAFGHLDPLITVDSAGILPYYGGFRAVDMLGLNDRYIARHRPADFGTGWVAHELSNPTYVLSRKPDLITHNGGGEGCGWSACTKVISDLIAEPDFKKDYVRARLSYTSEPPIDGRFWVRRDGKAGLQVSATEIKIPAIMLNSEGELASFLDSSLRITSIVTAATPVQVDSLPLTAGAWRISLIPESSDFIIKESSCEKTKAADIISCSSAEGTPLHSLEIVPLNPKSELIVRELTLTRIDP